MPDDLSEIHKLAGVPPMLSPLLMPFTIAQKTASDLMMALPPPPGMVVMQTTEEAKKTETAPVRSAEPIDKIKTRIRQTSDYTIRRSEVVFEEGTPGELEELMVRSTSAFSVELHINGAMSWQKSMAELIDLSEDVNGITAAYRDGIYRFSISKIDFESIFVRVFLPGTGTFDIYSKVGPQHGRR
jgi:hypothetical protein